MFQRRIEEAALNAWPALQQILLDGWILRFSKGYTKRANSVNPLYASRLDVREKVDVCEQLYAEKRLRPVFRLTPISSPPDLDQVLESRGYWKADPTFVLHLDLRDHTIQPAPSRELRVEGLDDWLYLFCRFSQSVTEKHQTHMEILQAIPSKRLLVSLMYSGQPVACGLGVLENRYFGLFDLVTDPDQRNKGYGTQVVSGLLSWAQEQGAKHAYLQVMSKNEPARHLYAKLGFEDVYQYWYRITESQHPS
jgi:ribosomal protein S18 acetylase RimI-like enzyme